MVHNLDTSSLSQSQVQEMASPDAQIGTRPMDAGPCTFVAADALAQGPRGRPDRARTRAARDGRARRGLRRTLGFDVSSAENGVAWLDSSRDFAARSPTGVALVTSDALRGSGRRCGRDSA